MLVNFLVRFNKHTVRNVSDHECAQLSSQRFLEPPFLKLYIVELSTSRMTKVGLQVVTAYHKRYLQLSRLFSTTC